MAGPHQTLSGMFAEKSQILRTAFIRKLARRRPHRRLPQHTFSQTPSAKMPTTLDKTRKHISKKRNGVINSLHEKSRDSMRLRKASIRDQRLEKLAYARNKKEQPICK